MWSYPAYQAGKGAADWWSQTVAVPYENYVSVLQEKGPGWAALGGVATGLVRSPGIMAEFIGMVPAGTERLARETIRSPASLPGYAAGGLMLQAQSITEGVTRRPWEFAGEQLGMFLITYAMGEAYARLPVRLALDTAMMEDIQATSLGIMRTRGSVSTFRPLVGLTREGTGWKGITSLRPSVGMPKRIMAIPETGFTPVTPFEAEAVARMTGAEGLKVTLAQQVRMGTQGTGLRLRELEPVIREITESHGIPNAAEVTREILGTMKSEKAQLYGSPIQRGIGMERGEVGLARIPRDIDVHVQDVTRFNQDMMAGINRMAGGDVVGIRGAQVFTKGTGRTLFDTHAVESISSDLLKRMGETGYIGYGMKSERLRGTLEGIKAITGSEQASRKF